MSFSILFAEHAGHLRREIREEPAFFRDLNLDQIVEAITAGKQEYDLKPFFYIALPDEEAVRYRQEVMQELGNQTLLAAIRSFADNMRAIRGYLGSVEKLYYHYHKAGWFLEAVDRYCAAVTRLAEDLNAAGLRSRGFLAFREYVAAYARAGAFRALVAETRELKDELTAIRYCLLIKDGAIKVRQYEAETDYSVDVEETFAKFKQGVVQDYKAKFASGMGMNHIEAQILDCVAQLYPDSFARLDTFCAKYSRFPDETLVMFDREVQFYMAYLEHTDKLKQAGLRFCYPLLSATCKEIYDYDGFDLALAAQLVGRKEAVVCNDFHLQGRERIIVVTGPNQGGKTTFARTFGQLHYLAGLGCPVPGRQAKLFLCDRLFTHFEKEEDINNLRSKLQDDLVRIHDILDRTTANSIIIMNEIFTSTTLNDAVLLGRKIMQRIMELDLLCVCVTFIDELAALSEQTVSMVSTVVPDDPARRTYRIVRRPADGLAHAISIAEKYRLTYRLLKERIPS